MATSLSNALADATATSSTLDDPDTITAGTIATASNPFVFLLLTQESAMSANLVVSPAQYKIFAKHLRFVESGVGASARAHHRGGSAISV